LPLKAQSLDALWALNEAHAEETSSFSLAGFQDHLQLASGVFSDSSLKSLLILFHMKLNYRSVNYKWLQSHGFEGVYIDRIIIGSELQNQGYGRALYQKAKDWAIGQGFDRLLCEVNLIPDNANSLRFHQTMGFEAIEDISHNQMTSQGFKKVQFMQWIL